MGDRLPFSGGPAADLTDLYVEARYSDHPMDEQQMEEAERLSTDLGKIVDQGVSET